MFLESVNRNAILQDRAAQLARVRSFFAQRGVLEVDVPILGRTASVDAHIDLIEAFCCGKRAYLHSSPEYGMKRLLSEGLGDIYQLSHVFRDQEKGSRHTPEFMMIEWYRLGFTLKQMTDESVELARLFLEDIPQQVTYYTYKEALIRFAGSYPEDMEERDALFGFEVEPHLGVDTFTVITDFPPEQAALSQIGENGMAERFELFYQGFELANGYHELLDVQEQKGRFEDANQKREELGKKRYDALDLEFLHALEQGMPDCCGVAVGFDRLMMLRHQLEEIRDASRFFI